MTRESQKERERKFLLHFKKLFEEFPKGRIEASETPDFIVFREDNSKLGIELIEFFPNETEEEKVHLQLTKNEEVVVRLAQEEFEANFKINLMISLSFDPNLRCPKSNRKQFAKSIAKDVYKCYQSVNNQSGGYKVFNKNQIETQYLDRIFIVFKEIKNGLWDSGHGAQTRDLRYQELTSMINTKEIDLPRIKMKVDKAWLLIVEPFDMLNFDGVYIYDEINSGFDKIFILRTILEEMIELK